MNAKLLTGALTAALMIAGCSTPQMTATVPAMSAEEQAFLASSATSARYNVMLASVVDAVDKTAVGASTSVDASASGVSSTSVTSSTSVVTSTSVGAVTSLVSQSMQAHAALSHLNASKVACSSTRNDWFRAANLTDGNLHSAWSASATDTAPTLTFDLNNCTTLRGLGIKQSGGVKFDVAVSVKGGAWTVVGTNLSSEAKLLDWVELKATAADQVQLRFHGDKVGKLMVCEVQWFGEACTPPSGGGGGPVASPSPSATPLPIPSILPSVMPSAVPSAIASVPPGDVDSAFEGSGECSIVIAHGNHHHLQLGCHVRHHAHRVKADEGTCELVDVEAGVKLRARVDGIKWDVDGVHCHGRIVGGDDFTFTLTGTDVHTCSWHGGGIDFDAEAATDLAGRRLNCHVVAQEATDFAGDDQEFVTQAHVEMDKCGCAADGDHQDSHHGDHQDGENGNHQNGEHGDNH